MDFVTFLDASVFYAFKTVPRDFRDMEETFLRRHELYEATIRHDANDLSVVHFAYFGDSYDSTNLSHCSVDAVLVRSRNLNLTYAIHFFDGDGSTRFLLAYLG